MKERSAPTYQTIVPIYLVRNMSLDTPGPASLDPPAPRPCPGLTQPYTQTAVS